MWQLCPCTIMISFKRELNSKATGIVLNKITAYYCWKCAQLKPVSTSPEMKCVSGKAESLKQLMTF